LIFYFLTLRFPFFFFFFSIFDLHLLCPFSPLTLPTPT
ncbi:hypothetical protein VN97_g6117, partial [Penicillium thymicola]